MTSFTPFPAFDPWPFLAHKPYVLSKTPLPESKNFACHSSFKIPFAFSSLPTFLWRNIPESQPYFFRPTICLDGAEPLERALQSLLTVCSAVPLTCSLLTLGTPLARRAREDCNSKKLHFHMNEDTTGSFSAPNISCLINRRQFTHRSKHVTQSKSRPSTLKRLLKMHIELD